jgi:hypothetical protein
MPDVTVAGVAGTERWVAVAGGPLAVEAATGLAAAVRPTEVLRPWPAVAEGVRQTEGAAWRVQGPDWGLRLLPQDRLGSPRPVRVFLAEHAAAVVDGRRWLHETVYWLRHEARTDLRASFPEGAEVVGVSVDGREVAPLQSGPGRLWLPLPGRAGVRKIQLRWLYEEGAEPLEAPNLERPRLEGAEEGPALWTVYVPAGWEAARSEGRSVGTGPMRAAAVALYRAEAQLRISRVLADHVREGDGAAQLAAAQARFAADCRHAEQALALAGGSPVLADGRPLRVWLQALRAENQELSQQHALDGVRRAAERRTREGVVAQEVPASEDGLGAVSVAGQEPPGGAGGVFPARGRPVTWQARPGEPAPRLRLASEESRAATQALIASGPWLALLAAVWALSLSPLLLGWVRLFWAEPFTLLGALGWYVAGPTVVVLLLLVLGVGGRVFHLGRGVRWFLRRRIPAPAPSAGGRDSHG